MSTTDPVLSLPDARRIAVAAQALDRVPGQATKADVLAMVRRLGCVQIDTIHIVARSAYLVLWSRLGAYDQRWLDELLYPDRLVFEYWAHAASIVPIEHWPLFRRRMLRTLEGESSWAQWRIENAALIDGVRDEIRARGPLGATHFEAPEGHKSGGWWDWKPAKSALDYLWSAGELMIERRINFHRRYELRERLLPAWDDADLPDQAENRRRLAELALGAMGIATVRQLADYFRQPLRGLAATTATLVEQGIAQRVAVEGWNEPAFVYHEALAAFGRGLSPAEHTTFLSPFDNLTWDRRRTLALWGFDYTLECYVPAPKRRWGYFVLPILWRGELVGRLDAKAERRDGVFRVKALYLEPGVPLDAVAADIDRALRDCAAWHGTPEVVVELTDPVELAPALKQAVTPR